MFPLKEHIVKVPANFKISPSDPKIPSTRALRYSFSVLVSWSAPDFPIVLYLSHNDVNPKIRNHRTEVFLQYFLFSMVTIIFKEQVHPQHKQAKLL